MVWRIVRTEMPSRSLDEIEEADEDEDEDDDADEDEETERERWWWYSLWPFLSRPREELSKGWGVWIGCEGIGTLLGAGKLVVDLYAGA